MREAQEQEEEDDAEEVFYQTHDILVDKHHHVQVFNRLVRVLEDAEAEEAVAAIAAEALPEAIAVMDEAIAAMRRAREEGNPDEFILQVVDGRARVIRLNNQLAVGPRWSRCFRSRRRLAG